MTEKFTPKSIAPDEEFLIDDLDTLKVISDPFRLRILESMGSRYPVTVKTVAEEIGVSPKKLYYHINLLEEHGLITQVDQHVVSGIIEKWYQVRAKSFRVQKDLLTVSEEAEKEDNWRMILSTIFDATREDILQAVNYGAIHDQSEDWKGEMYLYRNRLRLTPEQFDAMKERLNTIIDEFCAEEPDPSESVGRYGLTIAFYPTAPTGESQGERGESDG